MIVAFGRSRAAWCNLGNPGVQRGASLIGCVYPESTLFVTCQIDFLHLNVSQGSLMWMG